MGIGNKADSIPFRLFAGRVSGSTLEITYCNFPALETGLSSMSGRPLYAIPSDVSREDLDRAKSSLSGNTNWADLINDELPDAMSFYYEEVLSGAKWSGGFLNF